MSFKKYSYLIGIATLVIVLTIGFFVGEVYVISKNKTKPYVYHISEVYRTEQTMLDKLKDKYEITQGIFYVTGLEICNYATDIGCQYNNHLTPYGFVVFPDPPEIQNNRSYRFKVEFNNTLYVPKWNLATDEVIIFGGIVPPEMRYFSFQNYIIERNNYGFWRFIFASLGNSRNKFRIKTKDGKFMIISSANKILQNDVKDITDGFYENDNFLEFPREMPTQFLTTKLRYSNIGYDNPDVFNYVARFALPKNKEEFESYLKNTPIWVYKLKLKDSVTNHSNITDFENLNKAPEILKRRTNTNELSLWPEFKLLGKKIRNEYKRDGTNSIFGSFISKSGLDVVGIRWGIDCNSDWYTINCMGEILDTIYATTLPSFSLQKDDIVYIYGVNHHELNNTAYSGIVLYDMKTITAITSVDDTKLKGSAKKWLGYDADQFFVHKFMYECPVGDNDCTNIPLKPFPNTTIGNSLNILGRDYNDVQFNTNDVIFPRYLIITKGHRPYKLSPMLVTAIVLGFSRYIFIGAFTVIIGALFIKFLYKS